jgi:hypothetical protein
MPDDLSQLANAKYFSRELYLSRVAVNPVFRSIYPQHATG